MPIYHSLLYSYQTNKNCNKESAIALADNPNGKVVVFIHGFNGGPNKTWENFFGLLCCNPAYEGIDLIFYHYDSLRTQAIDSGVYLSSFMNDLTSKANYFKDVFTKSHTRPDTFRYSKVILVAHSLGAIVCRRAMINSIKNEYHWHEISEMILFAPAHKGAISIRAFTAILFPKPLETLACIIRYYITTINDVDAQLNESSVKNLETVSAMLQTGENKKYTIAKAVYHAAFERIVDNNTFLLDPEPVPLGRSKHTNVANPYSEYLDPVTELTRYL